MKIHLLDTNLLVALLWPGHRHHAKSVQWFQDNRKKGWATCAMTQAGFVRILSNPAFSRDAVQPREAIQVLEKNTSARDHHFWHSELQVSHGIVHYGLKLIGHQQVTDAYLLSLAIHHNGILATMDKGVAALVQGQPGMSKHMVLIE